MDDEEVREMLAKLNETNENMKGYEIESIKHPEPIKSAEDESTETETPDN